MNLIDIYWPLGFMAANALLLALAAIALLRARAESARLRAFADSPAAAALAPEPYDDRELRRMFDRRCTMLEQRLTQLVERERQAARESALPAVTPHKNELPVAYAVRMAQSGASVDDLVRGCGLNRGEAQLLLRLHARRAEAGVATH